MTFVWCPSGTFSMGSAPSETGRVVNETQHQVELTQGFWIATTEVTQKQWDALMDPIPNKFPNPLAPVDRVSWVQANEFCQKLTEQIRSVDNQWTNWQASLPAEAQWEYSLRAGSTSTYHFGYSSSEITDYGWIKENSENSTHPVALKKPNAWGIHDMVGNAGEWCRDWWKINLGTDDVRDPLIDKPSSTPIRVIRGAAWMNGDSVSSRSAFRPGGFFPDGVMEQGFQGFRPVLVPLE